MPDRLYLPRDPTRFTRIDRVGSHFYAFMATLGGCGLGLMIVVTTIIRWYHPHVPPTPPWELVGWERWLNPAPSLAMLPPWQGLVLGILLLVGGLVWMVATLCTFAYVEDYWKVSRAGLLMLIIGWAGYVFCAASQRPEWVVPWWLGLTHLVAYLGGFMFSLDHQWRKKGYPKWVGLLRQLVRPLRWVSKGLDFPFTWLENHILLRGGNPPSDNLREDPRD